MRNEIGEPTGMRVRTVAGAERVMEFTDFLTAIERGDIRPEDEVCSHIVTQNQWVRVGEMRIYQEVIQGVERDELKRERAAQQGIWPPAPRTSQRE